MIQTIPVFMWKLLVGMAIPKGTPIHYAHLIGSPLVFSPPIDLRSNDCIWVDVRNGNVEIVERDGIAIWRSGWLN